MVEGGGFEPPKASPTDLQSVPFDRSGTPPQNWKADARLGRETFKLAKGLEPPTTSLQMRCSTN